eukprot:7220954-Pyramimonas_sp.AAC.1
MFSAPLRSCEAWNLRAKDMAPPRPPLSWTPALNLHPEELGGTPRAFASNESVYWTARATASSGWRSAGGRSPGGRAASS